MNPALPSLRGRLLTLTYAFNQFKEEKVEKLKLKKAIEKGNMEVAKIHAENAIRWLFNHFPNSNLSEKMVISRIMSLFNSRRSPW